MSFLGTWAIGLAFLASIYGAIAGSLAAVKDRRSLAQSARGAMLASALATTVAVISLLYLLVESDFSVAYVAEYSSLSLAVLYKLSALWAGLPGSSLFWSWLLSVYAGYLVFKPVGAAWKMHTYALAILAAIEAFFLFFIILYAMPFVGVASPPADGLGLNPLLQNPGMSIHPPALYLGYVGMAIPFAYGMAALLTKAPGGTWLALTKRWTMLAWLFLSFGIVFGGQWAYVELGWGGYWAWDPVENASFIPWLTATAFLHSSFIQERLGIFKLWNMVLVSVTFSLVILGTFITKSGVVSSVHAFAGAPGWPLLLAFLGLMVLFAGILIYKNLDQLRDREMVTTFFSREGLFVLLNLLLLSWAAFILLGTFFPLLTHLSSGRSLDLGSGFYDTITVPIVFGLIIIMGLSQVIRWKQGDWREVWRGERVAIIVGFGLLLGLFLAGYRGWTPFVFGGSAYALVVSLQSIWRGFRGKKVDLSRYGGHLVHLGVLFIVVGAVASTVYASSKFLVMAPGNTARVGGYTLHYRDLFTRKEGGGSLLFGQVDVSENGRPDGSLKPAVEFWPNLPQPYTRVAIKSAWGGDLYLILAGYQGRTVTIQAITEPLVDWIWAGLWVLVAGGILALGRKRSVFGSEALEGGEGR